MIVDAATSPPSARRMAFGRLERNPGAAADERHQHDAADRRDARAAGDLHDHRAADDAAASSSTCRKTDAAQPSDAPQFIAVALDKDGRTFFGDEALDAASLRRARRRRGAAQPADRGAAARRQGASPYGRVAELIGVVQKAGLNRIGFVTDPEK